MVRFFPPFPRNDWLTVLCEEQLVPLEKNPQITVCPSYHKMIAYTSWGETVSHGLAWPRFKLDPPPDTTMR
jgi:hypothetical protein